MMDLTNKSAAEIATMNFNAISIFRKFNIDFSYNARIPLKQSCDQLQLNYNDVEAAIKNLNSNVNWEEDFDHWDLDLLTAFIMHKHHSYVYRMIPLLLSYAEKTAELHGDNYPETKKINELTKFFLNDLKKHLCKEEKIVFPLIDTCFSKRNIESDSSPTQDLADLIQSMINDHNEAKEITRILRLLSNNYTLETEECEIYSNFYRLLQEFEFDLEVHTHLENNILFPKALALQYINGKTT